MSKERLRIYFALAFGMPVILGIFMAIGFHRGEDAAVSLFPMVWMYLPATAVMAGTLYADRKERRAARDSGTAGSEEAGAHRMEEKAGAEPKPALPRAFYLTFLIGTAGMVLLTVWNVFCPSMGNAVTVNYWMMAMSLICLVELLALGKGRREAWGLSFTKNGKRSLAGIGLFVLLYLLLTGISVGIAQLCGQDSSAFAWNPAWASWLFLIMPLNLVLSFTAFLGEEYGWRYYLQPVLQEKCGLRRGVIALGLLWGIWHLPINLFYYSPDTALQSVLVQLAGCVGMAVFFGWVYLRTQNVWAVTVIHFLNNNLGMALFGVSAAGVERQWGDTMLTIALYLMIYLPFLFTKEYRAKQNGNHI